MPTYGDIAKKIRALLDDQITTGGAVYNDQYLLEYINQAQAHVALHLASRGVDSLRTVTKTPIYVPAGTTELKFTPRQSLANYISESDNFGTAGPVLAPWVVTPTGTSPTAITPAPAASFDPWGGTAHTRWRFDGDTLEAYHMSPLAVTALRGATVNSLSLSGSVWMRSVIPDSNVNMTIGVGIATTVGAPVPPPTIFASETVNVGNEWRRFRILSPQVSVATTPTWRPCLYIKGSILPSTMATCDVDFARATLSVGPIDVGDVQTKGYVLTGNPVNLPNDLIRPEQLWEATVGAQAWEFVPMRGPVPLPVAQSTNYVRWWDVGQNEIKIIAPSQDRLVKIEYWCSPADFSDNVSQGDNEDDELQLMGCAQPIAYLAASLAATARGQVNAASVFGIADPDKGISGLAGESLNNVVNIFNRTQQSEPMIRRPYFGIVRYPGLGGNSLGGWPWYSQ